MDYQRIEEPIIEESGTPIVTSDLDSFLSGVYRYYCEKGLHFVILRCISSLIASLLTFGLSVLLLLLIDWNTVAACTNEASCLGRSLIYENPFSPMSLYRFLIICQLVPLGLYTVILSSASAIAKVREAIRIGEFYKTGLGISDDSLLTFITWPEIIDRIIDFQENSKSLSILQPNLTAIEITNVIMRTDNFVLYMMKNAVSGNMILQSRVMKWCLQFGLVLWLFDERYRVRSDWTVAKIRTRLKLLGYTWLLLIGPMVIFALILLIIREMDDVRSNRTSLTDRKWTPLARNKLRVYSEMEHFLDSRLCSAQKFGEDFALPIVSNPTSGVGILKFVAGALLAVLALIGLVEDKSLVYLNLWGRNLFFYVAVLSIIVSVTSGMGVDKSLSLLGKKSAAVSLLRKIFWLPEYRMDSLGSVLNLARALDQVSMYFRMHYFTYRFANFITELVALASIPWFFLHVLPKSSFPNKLIDMMDTQIYKSDNLGDFCQAGWFKRGTNVELERTGNLASAVLAVPFDIGMSAVSFSKKYKSFVPPVECEAMILLVDQFAAAMKNDDEGDDIEFWYYVLHVILTSSGGSILNHCDDELLKKAKRVWTDIIANRSEP